jgi:hypothetical protein
MVNNDGGKMKIWHETDPAVALEIMRTGIFRGKSVESDNGLNAYPVDEKERLYTQNQAAFKGAKMIFEWSGPVLVTPAENLMPWHGGTLYDEQYHRLFIPCGTYSGLRLVGIELLGNRRWDDEISTPSFPAWSLDAEAWKTYLASIGPKWKSKEAAKLAATVSAMEASPIPIRVLEGNE